MAKAEVTVAASAGTTAYVERTASGTVFVDALLALGGDEMVTACEVTVAPTSVGASDSLAVGSPGGLSDNGGCQSATKKLSLSGTASVADYQAALRSVSFSNPRSTPDMSFDGRRTVVFKVTTASGDEVTAFKYVQLSLVDVDTSGPWTWTWRWTPPAPPAQSSQSPVQTSVPSQKTWL